MGKAGSRSTDRPDRAGLKQCCHYDNFAVIEGMVRYCVMAVLTIRNVPEDVHRALRVRAALHGRSTEAGVRVSDALAAIGRKVGLTDEEFAILESVRDRTPAEPPSFE